MEYKRARPTYHLSAQLVLQNTQAAHSENDSL